MARRQATMVSRIAAVAAGIIVTLLALMVIAPARDDGRYAQSPDRDFFRSLTDQAGRSCCDGADGVRLEDPDWTMQDGHYRVRLDGQWIDIQPEQIVKQGNKVGFAVVWPWRESGGTLHVRCFMPGSGA